MSASLVGSEMCIRDRHRGHFSRCIGALLASCKSVVYDSVSYLVGREPVSYTHLTLPTICSV
eukprot:13357662-Alexandrium_andersonii.AAC.1